MRAEIEKIVHALEEEGRPFTPEEAKRAVDENGVEVKSDGLDELVQGVLEEGLKRTLTVLDRAREVLGIPPHPEAGDVLREGGVVHVWCAKSESGEDHEVVVRLVDKTGKILADDLHSPPRGFYLSEEFVHLRLERGLAAMETPSGTVVGRSWAFFKGHDPDEIEGVADTLYALRSVLTAMGASGIRDALGKLSHLETEEVQVEDGYILAKGEDFWLLRRGTILGDSKLDRALLEGETVTLSFPGDVEVALKVLPDGTWANTGLLYVPYARIRWGEEAVAVRGDRASCGTLDKMSLAKAIQKIVREEIEGLENGTRFRLADLSPEMLIFLKAFARHEDPFRALAEGRFAPYLKAELFLDM